MRLLNATIILVLTSACARYEITDKKPAKDRLGEGKNFTDGDLCSQTIEEPAVVCKSPDNSFMIRATPRQALPGANINFTGTCNGVAVSTWNFGDGSTAASANPVHQYAQPGTYEATGSCLIGGVLRSGKLTILIRDNGTIGDLPMNPPSQNPRQN